MDTAWQRYLEMATGLTSVTRKKAETAVKGLVKRGEIAAERTEKAVDELLERSEQNREALGKLVRHEADRAVKSFGVATKQDLERLERKVDRLAAGGTKSTAKKSAKKSAKKGAKKAAKKSTKKTTAAKKTGPAKKTSPPSGSAS